MNRKIVEEVTYIAMTVSVYEDPLVSPIVVFLCALLAAEEWPHIASAHRIGLWSNGPLEL